MSEMTPYYRMLREVSRTFALSIEQLPRGPRDALTLGYLLLRVSDGLEDYPSLTGARKAALLWLWDDVLGGAAPPTSLVDEAARLDTSNPEIRVALQASELIRLTHSQPAPVRETLLTYVRATTRGMARWQELPPVVQTEAELDDYMHQVAGMVGYLITDVFAAYSPAVRARREALLPLAREFGLGLQTVNIVRGLHDDFRRGWVFVPAEYYAPLGLTAEQLFEPAHRAAAMRVVARLVAKAERHLAYGMQYVLLLPRRMHRLRLMCIWPLLFAARTLAVTRNDPRALASDAKVSRPEVRRIMRDSALRGWSNRWLRGYFDALNPGTTAPARGPALAPPDVPAAHRPIGPREHAETRRAPGTDAGSAGFGAAVDDAQARQSLQSPTTSSR
jgi:farnesyl-diphosphate farnesyltransferase